MDPEFLLCFLCAFAVLFPYATGYCLILPQLQINRRAAEFAEPLNPLFSLDTSKGCCPLCAL